MHFNAFAFICSLLVHRRQPLSLISELRLKVFFFLHKTCNFLPSFYHRVCISFLHRCTRSRLLLPAFSLLLLLLDFLTSPKYYVVRLSYNLFRFHFLFYYAFTFQSVLLKIRYDAVCIVLWRRWYWALVCVSDSFGIFHQIVTPFLNTNRFHNPDIKFSLPFRLVSPLQFVGEKISFQDFFFILSTTWSLYPHEDEDGISWD